MMLMLRAATGAIGTNLVLEKEPVAVSIEQVLMGKKRKQLLVSEGFRAQIDCCKMPPQTGTRRQSDEFKYLFD